MKAIPSISFIIVNFNGKHHLKDCFETLKRLNYPADKLEFIMVDNGSIDGSVKYVKSRFPFVKIIENASNEGFAKPNNDAAKIASGKYVALINNDMRISPNWINDMLNTLEECNDNSYVCAGSKILNWDGTKLDFAGGSISFYGHGYQYDFGIDVNKANVKYSEDKDIFFACGGAMLIEKKVFLEVGGFDEDYFAYFEDVDLGWRLWLLGYKVRFCSKAICYHKHNSTSKKIDRTKLDIMYNRNSLYTVYKNYASDKMYSSLLSAVLLKIYKGNYSNKTEEIDERKTQALSIGEFMNNLDKMKAKRDFIQSSRKVSDEVIISRFIDNPYKNLIIPTKEFSYNETVRILMNSMEVGKYFGKQVLSMLIVSSDNIGKKMAGPGIRYLEIAKQLSKICNVTLATPNESDIELIDYNIDIITYNLNDSNELVRRFGESDIVLMQGLTLDLIPNLKSYCSSRIVIFDLYDPFTIENLEVHRGKGIIEREEIHNKELDTLLEQINIGDYFFCANEKQMNYWVGMLSAMNRVNPREYELSQKLEKLIGIVPFGISVDKPVHTKNVLESKIGNFKKEDKVFIWGGGIWNWFDPLSLIKAISKVSKSRSDIKLFFLGVKHPNPDMPEMEMTTRAIELAEILDIKDKYVFFNMDWVDYEERQNFLLESYAGVSFHFDNLETKFSFRTRILDYLWAELPIIATEGDYFADEIENNKFGLVIKYGDVDGLADALIKLSDDVQFYETCKRNINAYKDRYRWDVVTKPLLDFCSNPIKKSSENNVSTHSIITDINQPIKDDNVGALLGEIKCGQIFRCRYPNFASIDILVGTYARSNSHIIKFKLLETDTETMVAEEYIEAASLTDNSWLNITFKPILNSEGRYFYFYFEAPEASLDNCITFYKTEQESSSGNIWLNGKSIKGSLVFRTGCILTKSNLDEIEGVILPEKRSQAIASTHLHNSREEVVTIGSSHYSDSYKSEKNVGTKTISSKAKKKIKSLIKRLI